MKTFVSLSDLSKLAEDDPAKPVVKQLLEWLIAENEFPEYPYNPDDHGFIALVEPGDIDRELDDIDMPRLMDIMWEGVPTRIEPVVFTFAERLSRDYKGGYWDFYTLSNGGFYLAPSSNLPFHVICENHFDGDLSADAFGITACLYAYSNLSFSGPDAFADICFDQYHWLREFMFEHPEVEAILKATD